MKHEAMKISMTDGTMLEAKIDRSDREAVGVVHIFHGMAEHMDRYTPLVHKLNAQGYHVLRHNHRGHGQDIDSIRGHFESIEQVVTDAYEVQTTLRPDIGSDLPYIVLGHSMGSIIARQFSQTYPDVLQGLILSGTGLFRRWQGYPVVVVLKLVTLLCGKQRKLNWVNHAVTGRFNKHFKPRRTSSDWISSNHQVVDAYIEDDYAGFKVSNQLVYSVTQHMMTTATLKNIKRMNKNIPVLLVSGKDDPFGEQGEGVRRLARLFKQGGIHHITVQLYPHKRHEVLFEHDHETVWKHMLDWMSRQIIQKVKVREEDE
ncbi:alpha/beta fold hydrolase [Staphylococcus sp. 17KM0847]|uniref:alpha/beta fold hydrolase n=1 Tax=Staphylococcus sp. 17KM0847 TaxID=2583989 RepID=UPI0035B5E0B3